MYIGLDVGTSGTKAARINAKGEIAAAHQVSYGFSSTEGGKRELDGEQIWRAVKDCLKTVGSGSSVKTITVSALGEAIVPVDQDGFPIGPVIIGTDCRGEKELEELRERIGERRIVDITGQNLSEIYSVNKIIWMQKHQPEVYRKAWKILLVQDYIVYRLCREAAIDYSMAARTMVFDAETMDWSKTMLEAADLEAEKLSRPMPGGSIVGEVTRELREELGLPGGVKVVLGTHDHVCNAIGSGVFEEGSCANTVGTTEGLTAVLKRADLSSENVSKYQISCQPFPVKGLYNTIAWSNASGVLLRWFVEQMVQEERSDLIHTFAKMNQSMDPEPTSLMILPHFSGAATPYMDCNSKGAILGLTLNTKREDIYKALMESANFELALILNSLISAGLKPRKVVATGGALSPQLLQIKADILGLEVHTVKMRQTAVLGGAILGAAAAKDYPDIGTAVKMMIREADSYVPDPVRSAIYREKAELYRELYPSVASISHRL